MFQKNLEKKHTIFAKARGSVLAFFIIKLIESRISLI